MAGEIMKTLGDSAQLAWDTIQQKPVDGIPSWAILPLEHRMIDRIAGVPEGTYANNPEPTYIKMQQAAGTCMVDQYIPLNPLTISDQGYEDNTEKSATTGLETVELDGMIIDSPEAVIEHIENFIFPKLKEKLEQNFDAETEIIITREQEIQKKLGSNILKVPYQAKFPMLLYNQYGYTNFFMAFALYPEMMEKLFSLQADTAVKMNQARLQAIRGANLPPLLRLDHDMADSRSTLADIKVLDDIWFPHFARAIKPLTDSGVKLIWHCDGNLMQMVPRLLECGLNGFQGFQYEDGMDYEKICKMKDRNGNSLIIIGGVSVTTTLPHGSPGDVKKEIDWLVANGPETGLFLGGSSSIAPGVSWNNLQTMLEGFKYYRTHGKR